MYCINVVFVYQTVTDVQICVMAVCETLSRIDATNAMYGLFSTQALNCGTVDCRNFCVVGSWNECVDHLVPSALQIHVTHLFPNVVCPVNCFVRTCKKYFIIILKVGTWN